MTIGFVSAGRARIPQSPQRVKMVECGVNETSVRIASEQARAPRREYSKTPRGIDSGRSIRVGAAQGGPFRKSHQRSLVAPGSVPPARRAAASKRADAVLPSTMPCARAWRNQAASAENPKDDGE